MSLTGKPPLPFAPGMPGGPTLPTAPSSPLRPLGPGGPGGPGGHRQPPDIPWSGGCCPRRLPRPRGPVSISIVFLVV